MYYVGIDISKAKLDCWLRPAGTPLQVGNGGEGFDRITEWLHVQGCSPEDTIICTEDTGTGGKRGLIALSNAGWNCTVEKTTPADKVSPARHRKDDHFDARLIAEYADRYPAGFPRQNLLSRLLSG